MGRVKMNLKSRLVPLVAMLLLGGCSDDLGGPAGEQPDQDRGPALSIQLAPVDPVRVPGDVPTDCYRMPTLSSTGKTLMFTIVGGAASAWGRLCDDVTPGVYVYDTESGQLLGSQELSESVEIAGLDADRQLAVLVDYEESTVSVMDVRTGQTPSTTPIELYGEWGIAGIEGQALLLCQTSSADDRSRLYSIDTSTQAREDQRTLPGSCGAIFGDNIILFSDDSVALVDRSLTTAAEANIGDVLAAATAKEGDSYLLYSAEGDNLGGRVVSVNSQNLEVIAETQVDSPATAERGVVALRGGFAALLTREVSAFTFEGAEAGYLSENFTEMSEAAGDRQLIAATTGSADYRQPSFTGVSFLTGS